MIYLKANIFITIFRFIIIKIFYFSTILAGIFSKNLKEKFRHFFVQLNNFVASKYHTKTKNLKILIILPHCLQNNDCTYRITHDIKNCKQCGKCVIAKFVDLTNEFNIPICIATGGTLARKAVQENQPDIILACACERDLSSGIYDSYPFLVYGILNTRPNGPCISTNVDIKIIENFLKTLLI